MNTKEELNALKEEVVTLNEKLHELTDEELEQVRGGGSVTFVTEEGQSPKEIAIYNADEIKEFDPHFPQ